MPNYSGRLLNITIKLYWNVVSRWTAHRESFVSYHMETCIQFQNLYIWPYPTKRLWDIVRINFWNRGTAWSGWRYQLRHFVPLYFRFRFFGASFLARMPYEASAMRQYVILLHNWTFLMSVCGVSSRFLNVLRFLHATLTLFSIIVQPYPKII